MIAADHPYSIARRWDSVLGHIGRCPSEVLPGGPMSDTADTPKPPRVFYVGRAIGMSFGVLGRNFGGFVILAFIIQLGVYFFDEWLGIHDPLHELGLADMASVAISLLAFSFLSAMVSFGTYRDLKGDRASLAEVVVQGFWLLLPVLLVSVVVTVIYLAGFILIIVPGVIALIFLWVAIPAAVVERTSVIGSLKRSKKLTKGSRWRIFGILVLFAVIFVLVLVAVGVISAFLLLPLGVAEDSLDAWTTQFGFVVGAVFALFFNVVVAVSYFLLRSQDEGVGVTDLAAVFD